MGKIQYINDQNLAYKDHIINGLHKYNKSQRGYREKDYQHFYVFEDEKLIGASHTKLASDWCHIKSIYYQDIEVLKAILNDIIEYYGMLMHGIQYNSIIPERVNDFKKLGFQQKGKLEDMPKGGENIFLILTEINTYQTDNEYEVISSDRPVDKLSKTMKKKNKRIRKKLNYSTERTDLQFVVLDDGKFAGGIYGNVQYDYLFNNVLFVKEDYRGQNMATNLMELIEEEAKERGITNIYITTFEFQALDFYKKHGYQVVMIIDDYPVGYKEYTVYKKL